MESASRFSNAHGAASCCCATRPVLRTRTGPPPMLQGASGAPRFLHARANSAYFSPPLGRGRRKSQSPLLSGMWTFRSRRAPSSMSSSATE